MIKKCSWCGQECRTGANFCSKKCDYEASKAFRVKEMATLYFSNGMSQSYANSEALEEAVSEMKGVAKRVAAKTYVFVPKK
jgi:hypothetical protein